MDGCSPISLHGAQRTALHYEIEVESAPSNAPAQSLASIVKAFAAAADKGEAVWRRSGGQAVLEIARVRFNKTGARAILLLQHTDVETGVAVSAHLVIDLAPSSKSSGTYHAILEHVHGLTKSHVEQAMQGLARRLFEFYFKDASGKFRQAHPLVRFTASPENAAMFAVECGIAQYEPEIRADVSVKLDALLKRRVAQRAA